MCLISFILFFLHVKVMLSPIPGCGDQGNHCTFMPQFKCIPGRNQTFAGAPPAIFWSFPDDTHNHLNFYLLLPCFFYAVVASRETPSIPLSATSSSHVELHCHLFSLKVIFPTTAGLGRPCFYPVSFSPAPVLTSGRLSQGSQDW